MSLFSFITDINGIIFVLHHFIHKQGNNPREALELPKSFLQQFIVRIHKNLEKSEGKTEKVKFLVKLI